MLLRAAFCVSFCATELFRASSNRVLDFTQKSENSSPNSNLCQNTAGEGKKLLRHSSPDYCSPPVANLVVVTEVNWVSWSPVPSNTGKYTWDDIPCLCNIDYQSIAMSAAQAQVSPKHVFNTDSHLLSRSILLGDLRGFHAFRKLPRQHHWTLFCRLDVHLQNKVQLGGFGSFLSSWEL